MPIRRFDHRARFRAAYLNNTIDQVNQLNKTGFQLQGQSGGTLLMGGSVGYSALYTPGDDNFYCPKIGYTDVAGDFISNWYWRNRTALPTWGTTYDQALAARLKAEDIASRAGAGEFDDGLEFNGWGGYDLTGVTKGSYVTGGGDEVAPTLSNYCAISDEVGEKTDSSWKSGGGASASVYPDDPGAPIASGNSIFYDHSGAAFSVTLSSAGFAHLLQSLPPGAIVTKALIPVKLGGFSKTVTRNTWDPVPVVRPAGGFTWDDNFVGDTSTDPSGEVSFALMARSRTGTFVNVGGQTMRKTTWDMIGTSVEINVSSESWAVIDVTEICNTFINQWKFNHEFFSFAFFPVMGPAPGSSATGWLASLPGRPAFEIVSNPAWDDGAGESTAHNHGYGSFAGASNAEQRYYQDYGPFNRETNSELIIWGSLAQGEGVMEWTYPSSLQNRVVSYRNMIRGDSPILG